jgi:hypothetical protein
MKIKISHSSRAHIVLAGLKAHGASEPTVKCIKQKDAKDPEEIQLPGSPPPPYWRETFDNLAHLAHVGACLRYGHSARCPFAL